MVEAEVECTDCGGTGVYRGFAEPNGIAVVCLVCKGTGCKTIRYTPFKTRKIRDGVKYVQKSAGSFVLSCGPVGSKISYNDFLNGKMP